MTGTTTHHDVRSLDSPDELRPFAAHGSMAVVKLANATVGRGTFEPGWRWSDDVRPLAGTDTCQEQHTLYVVSGRMRVALDNGTEFEVAAGDVAEIPAGHDGWTVGDEPCVVIEWSAASGYATGR
ncbi:MAG TPA: cupin domain-containing protein [Gaiellales bacterium]|nr:cupin domain-containing protein [Gaiellales bacterium]